MRWTIIVPAWGGRCVDIFLRSAIPSFVLAADHAGYDEVDLVVYTDQPDRIAGFLSMFKVKFRLDARSVPNGSDKYLQLSAVHREGLKSLPLGSRVMLMCADMVVSKEAFAACDQRFEDGQKAMVVCPSRTSPPESPVPPGMTSRRMLEWSMQHPHPFTKETFFGGRALPPSTMRFRSGNNITAHGFHFHPIAVVKHRDLEFKGTLDQDLLENFTHDEIHVVTDPDEMAAAEISPPEMSFRLAPKPVTAADIVRWAGRGCGPVNWWLAKHRVVLTGDGRKNDDEAIWEQVLQHEPFAR